MFYVNIIFKHEILLNAATRREYLIRNTFEQLDVTCYGAFRNLGPYKMEQSIPLLDDKYSKVKST